LTSPTGGANFTAPANIAVAANAADSDGSIAKVEFYRGSTLITTLTAAPYSFTWTGVEPGSYALTAVATDDLGARVASAAVSIAVNAGEAQVYYIQVDQLNTPRLIADSTGTTVWRWDQGEPFGNDVPNNDPSGLGAFEFPLRFPGQYFDRETNLNYNYFRDYDPALGRYVESDPLGSIDPNKFGAANADMLIANASTYAYVRAKPLLRTDQFGLLDDGSGGGGDDRPNRPSGCSLFTEFLLDWVGPTLPVPKGALWFCVWRCVSASCPPKVTYVSGIVFARYEWSCPSEPPPYIRR